MSKLTGNRLSRAKGAAWLLCLLPLGALAEQPDRAADSNPGLPDPTFAQGPNSAFSDNPMHYGRHRPSEDEWTAASAFLKQYSPKRMALMNELPDGQPKQHLRSLIYGRYLALRKVQEYFPQIYQVQLQRLMIEDTLFDLHRQYTSAASAQKPMLRANIRQQVQALFDNVQEDRQTRINRMKSWVADLETKKVEDGRNRETLIEQQLKEVIQHGPDALGRTENRARRTGASSTPNPGDSSPGLDSLPTTNPG